MFKLKYSKCVEQLILTKNSATLFFLVNDENVKTRLTEFEIKYSIKIPEYLKAKTDFTKKKLIKFYNSDSQPAIIFLLFYKENEINSDYFRNSLAGIVQDLYPENVNELIISIPELTDLNIFNNRQEYYFQTFVEGIFLGNYKFEKYKSEKDDKNLKVQFINQHCKIVDKSIKISDKTVEALNFAKDLVNEPAVSLTPRELVIRTREKLEKAGVKVTSIKEKELKKMNMNAILAVGSASPNKPELLVLHYKPAIKASKKIALVGKGLTYDAGGLSIKSTENMLGMKSDMSGAAAVIGAVLAAAQSKLAVEIYGIIPALENVISGNSYKPGDVIATASKKTVEVKDTDAEGRLVLADALNYASKLNPDIIIDIATLTGACVVALGEYAAGLFTKDDELAEVIKKCGVLTHERVWQLPLWDEYKDLLKSEIADISNVGSRWGGAITASKFLECFVGKDIKWAHLDIAGPASPNNLTNYSKTYYTAFGVRLLFEVLKQY